MLYTIIKVEYIGERTGDKYIVYFGRNCRVNIKGYILRDFVSEYGIKSKKAVQNVIDRLPKSMGFAKEEGKFKEFVIQRWQVLGDMVDRVF